MASQVFYRKWRPQTLAEVVGQEQVTRTLLNALHSDRVSHAYLFCGPRGTGKTSTGRILAKAVNCLTGGKGEPCNTCSICQGITEGRALDVIEIDAASNTGVDDIRDLRERVNYAPNQARYKVYIIDEVHMLSTSASNALLKTLEEPPPHIIFILATTEAHKILPTILSRCQRFDFRRISQADIVSRLTHICGAEGIHIEPEALPLIAKSATGSLRDAENLLEQITTYYGSEVALHQVQTMLGITGDWRVKELVRHIVNNDISAGMRTINNVNSDGLDLRQLTRELVEYLRGLLLIKTDSDGVMDFTTEDIAELKDLAGGATLPQILKAVKLFSQLEIKFDNYSTLPLELALADCVLSAGERKESPTSQTEPEFRQRPKVVEPEPTIASKPALPAEESISSTPTQEESTPCAPMEEGNISSVPTEEESIPSLPMEAGTETERLRLNWKRVIDEAPADVKRTPAIAFLRSAGVTPVMVEGDTVLLAFRYELHKQNMEKLENIEVAARIISNFLGHPCHVRCTLEDNHLVRAALKMGAQVIDEEEK